MNVKMFFKKHTATILTVMGVGGVVITAVTTAKAVTKAEILLGEAKTLKGSPLTRSETIKTAVPAYIPPAISCAVTVCCILGANILNKRQQAALTSAYMIMHRAYDDYKNKVKDIYGEEAHRDILEAIAAEKSLDDNRITAGCYGSCCCLDFGDPEEEERLFFDSFGERYFTSTFSKVLQAEYHLNRNFCIGGGVCLNELYEFLGIPKTEYGETVGWYINDNMDYYWIDFNHGKSVMDDGLECWIIETALDPMPEDAVL